MPCQWAFVHSGARLAVIARASVPIPKFARVCRTLRSELRNRRTLATLDSSAALNPKFATGLAAMLCELRVRGTSGWIRAGRTAVNAAREGRSGFAETVAHAVERLDHVERLIRSPELLAQPLDVTVDG